MTSFERMSALLSQTHLYNLNETSAISTEFNLFGQYFDIIEFEIDALLDNCFVETISSAGYESYMKLYSLPKSINWKLIKDIVNKRLAITNRDFTISGVKRCLASGGLGVTLTEDFAKNKVTIKVISDAKIFGTNEEKNAFIKSCIPCNVEPIIV